MTPPTVLTGEATSHLKLLKLENELVQMRILHVGAIPSFMNAYIIKNQIRHNPANLPLEDMEIDIILVNGEEQNVNSICGALSNIRPIVTYRKSYYLISKSDEIPFALIPILIKYLLKLKESITHMNRRRALNTSERFLQRITATIDENIDDHTLTMKKLSNLVFMSRSSFSKKIKKYTGLKPTEFINHYKLEKSKHLLLVTNWQISRIADHLGFCSQQYYCRLFKKVEGVNPSKYRKLHQNIDTPPPSRLLTTISPSS